MRPAPQEGGFVHQQAVTGLFGEVVEAEVARAAVGAGVVLVPAALAVASVARMSADHDRVAAAGASGFAVSAVERRSHAAGGDLHGFNGPDAKEEYAASEQHHQVK